MAFLLGKTPIGVEAPQTTYTSTALLLCVQPLLQLRLFRRAQANAIRAGVVSLLQSALGVLDLVRRKEALRLVALRNIQPGAVARN